jgi:predicted RNase H-like HicB family nuclease
MIKFQFTGTVKVVFFAEDNKIVAFCPALDLTTCGNNEREAKRNLEECLKIYLEETIKHGTLEKDLIKHGWKPHPVNMSFVPPSGRHESIPVHILKSIQIPIPVTLQ